MKLARPPIRKTGIFSAVGVVLFALTYFCAVVFVNRTDRSLAIEELSEGAQLSPLEDARLSVVTWNLGYGGLGAESDFVADGGEHLLPPDRQTVEKNIAGITAALGGLSADVMIFQEAAGPSFLTRGGDVLGAASTQLAGRDNAFSDDFAVSFAPPYFSPRHGLFSSVGAAGARRELVSLPLEPGFLMGVAKRRYHMHVVRMGFDGGEWTVINVHLSAFDDGADIRAQQLRAVLDFAKREYEDGAHVVIGGDWNFEFLNPGRPSTTAEDFKFWIHPFPAGELPAGWRSVIDPATPSVRTNERPYVKGENYTTIIDGFVISPNVDVESIALRDLDFQFSDHQPVRAVFRATGK